MDYFDGLNIVMSGNIPHHTGVIVNTPMYYSIQFNYSGSFFLQVGDHKPVYASGAYAFLTYPGEKFSYGTCGRNSRRHHAYICTCGERINKLIESGLFICAPDDPLVSVICADRFLHNIKEMIKLTSKTENNPRAVLLFEELLLEMYENRKRKNRCMSPHTAFLNNLSEEINAHPEKEYDFNCFADLCQITLPHFRRIFREHTGFAPQQFLIKARLRKAAELLSSSAHSVKEAAYLAGWQDEYYFSRLFRKHYQLSPGQYRKESPGTK